MESPLYASIRVHQKRRRINHRPAPMALALGSHRSAQRTVGIADQAERKIAPRIRPKGVVSFVSCVVKLGIPNHPLTELPSIIRYLWTDADDSHIVFSEPLDLVDKGRYLRPAPGSPLAPVEKYDRGWGQS